MTWQKAFNVSIFIFGTAIITWIGLSLGGISKIAWNDPKYAGQFGIQFLMDFLKVIDIIDPFISVLSAISSIVSYVVKNMVH